MGKMKKNERVILISALILTLVLVVVIVAAIKNNAQTSAHDTTPDTTTPDTTTPDTTTIDTTTPDTTTIDTTTPDTTMSDTTMPEDDKWAYPQDVIFAFEEKIGYQPQALVTEVEGKRVLRVFFENSFIEWPSPDSTFVGWRCEKTLFQDEFERLFKGIRHSFFPELEPPEREAGWMYPEQVVEAFGALLGYVPEYNIGYNNQFILNVNFKNTDYGIGWPDTDSSDDGWRIPLKEFEATFNANIEIILDNLGGELMYVEDVLDAFEKKLGYRPEYTVEYIESWNQNSLQLEGVDFGITSVYFGREPVWCVSKLAFESSLDQVIKAFPPET